MSPSSDQDSNNPSSGNVTNGKLSQKLSQAGVQIPSKNGKKHGTAKDKDNGVLAAVTKNASKLSKQAAASKWQSPKMEPATPAINDNTEPSPLLEDASTPAINSVNNQNTSEWAKNVPPYSSSPSNLINLGESPPTLPSSYEERGANFGGWTAREQRIPHSHNPSASPPAGRRRPLSYQLDSNFQHSPDEHFNQMSPYGRRTSLYSQHPRFNQPPLPHQAQAHFYGAPDANMLLSPRMPGLTPGENGFFCGFDLLPNQDFAKPAENVVINGYDGGLNMYTVTKKGLDKVLSIDGIRGGVYHAKIIPWTIRGGTSDDYPLVAVVVHGPVSSSSDVSSAELAVSDGNSVRPTESARGSPRPTQGHQPTEHHAYQTSVEIFSCNTKQHVATLLSLSSSPYTNSMQSPLLAPFAPEGSLTVRADDGKIVVASGSSGETWIFCQDETGLPKFRCIGKVWTTIQQGLSVNPGTANSNVDGDWASHDLVQPQQKSLKTPILSLHGRWLAYCPAAPASVVTSRAAIPGISTTTKVPGLNSLAPPNLPPTNCAVDMPDGESMIGKIAQVATQEVIKGAAYVGKQSLQVWNHYWNKSSTQSSNGALPYQTQTSAAQFPPTHAVTNQTAVTNKDPGLISILDLNALVPYSSGTTVPHPLVTFKVPHGCSFLSFAPSGLSLFTASSKGDVQFVWDLMRIQYVKSSLLKGSFPGNGPPGIHVRQIARFSRMTIARIVDVVWTKPHGERIAMVTEHGTVHILDLPASAFTWPPPRRKATANPSKDPAPGTEVASTSLTPASVASSAVSSLWSAAQPLVRPRRSSSGVTNATLPSVASHGSHGTQAFAAGFSRSVGAATGKMNEMRKYSSKQVRVQLPPSSAPPGLCCVVVVGGKRNDSIIVVGGGIVRVYTIKSRRADRPADKQKPSRGAKFVEYRLPSLPDSKLAPDNLSNLHLDEEFDEVQDLRWRKATVTPGSKATHTGTESSIPQAEIESNAPYQPFHTDRRVALHIFSHEEGQLPSPSVSALLSPNLAGVKASRTIQKKSAWAFGGPIKATKLDVGPLPTSDDDYDGPFDHRALPLSAIERFTRVAESSENIDQIVITTRRRKGAPRTGDENGVDIDEEGFFEDDCEVLDFASQRV
ncbi:hypothetical protein BP6252_07679 [Coleophoma cylindrospora]|uniref:WD40 repeat-like protein n=1 Tax=Coleophoma cylindrospora TaxID=1849047 RepID=A0A3D8RAW8_9HELO|nr:hypothetical protein BP6252_07679 [Coleophoma cylindrospora]